VGHNDMGMGNTTHTVGIGKKRLGWKRGAILLVLLLVTGQPAETHTLADGADSVKIGTGG